jgi:hypothetical protein
MVALRHQRITRLCDNPLGWVACRRRTVQDPVILKASACPATTLYVSFQHASRRRPDRARPCGSKRRSCRAGNERGAIGAARRGQNVHAEQRHHSGRRNARTAPRWPRIPCARSREQSSRMTGCRERTPGRPERVGRAGQPRIRDDPERSTVAGQDIQCSKRWKRAESDGAAGSVRAVGHYVLRRGVRHLCDGAGSCLGPTRWGA